DFTNNTFSDNAIALRIHVGNLTQLDSASSYAEPGSDTVIEVTGGPSASTRSDGIWLAAANAPYLITGQVDIAHEITIADGAIFMMEQGVLLDVTTGSITATGAGDGTLFTGTELVPGHWDGINFQ